MSTKADYMREFRRTHPEYAERQRELCRVRYSKLSVEQLEKEAVRKRKYREDNKEYVSRQKRNNWLLRNYNMTVDEYDELLSIQDYKCALCRKPFDNENNMPVDHNHKTGKVRGIVHHGCNRIIAGIEWGFSHPNAVKRYFRDAM